MGLPGAFDASSDSESDAESALPEPPQAPPKQPRVALFPSVTGSHLYFHGLDVPARPTERTTFDADLAKLPLRAFDEGQFSAYYPAPNADGSACIPPQPEGFPDPYLFPLLTANEVRRLTSLWYYTKFIHEDKHLLSQLQCTVDVVQVSLRRSRRPADLTIVRRTSWAGTAPFSG
jgi:hypothetical protein